MKETIPKEKALIAADDAHDLTFGILCRKVGEENNERAVGDGDNDEIWAGSDSHWRASKGQRCSQQEEAEVTSRLQLVIGECGIAFCSRRAWQRQNLYRSRLP